MADEQYLDCAMCDAADAFVISKQDPSTGYCFAEKREWTLRAAKEIVRNYYKCDECGTEYTSISNQCSSGCVNQRVTVCNKCLQASCWQGKFMCDEAQNAGTIEMTVRELMVLDREHPSYFRSNTPRTEV